MLLMDEPLMIRGQGQGIKSTSTLLDERLKRCELELSRVLRLDEQINLFEVEFKNLRSIFLEKNSQFKALVDEVKQWNEDLKLHKKNLREVVNTKDRQVQQFYLMQLSAWYERQNAILQSFRPTTQSGARVSTASRPGTSYQSNQYSSMTVKEKDQVFFPNSNMEDFINHHRSKHSHLEPPEDRIKEYTKKELYENLSTQGSRPATVMFNSTRPLTQGSLARPSTNYQSMRFLSTFDVVSRGQSRGGLDQVQLQQYQEGERLRSPGVINTSPWNYTGSFAFFQSFNSPNKPTSPQNSMLNRFQNTKFAKVELKESLSKSGEGEEIGDENQKNVEEGEEQSEVQNELSMRRSQNGFGLLQPSRKAFHNDRNTQMSYAPHIRPQGDSKSTYLNYNPSDELGEIRLENLWYINRNKAVQEKREHEELENHIQNWATNKGLLDQEIDKKNEITAHGSNFQELGKKIQEKIPPEPLSEKNYLQKEITAEENEDEILFNNYINIVKLSKEEKLQMAHPSANDESIYEIASKIDQSIRTPRSQRSQSRNNNNEFQEILQLEKSMEQSEKSYSAKKKNKQSQDFQVEDKIVLEERPKTMYVNLRQHIKNQSSENNPLIGMEIDMKRKRLAELRQSKGKIIGQTQTKLGEEADEEEIIRRKQQSLQMYNRKGGRYRPFTTMYKRLTQDNLRAEQLNEIEKVRNGFAKKGIKCSLKTITQSLSRPVGLPLNNLILPAPGSMLFENPFNNFGKKSSKKKKSS